MAPVAVVRHVNQSGEGVVVGVEWCPAEPVVRAALEQARSLTTYLRVLHVWSFVENHASYVFSGAGVEEFSASVVDDLTRALGPVLEEFPDVEVRFAVGYGRRADALITESDHAALLVLGRHDPLTPAGSHLGPGARAVLASARCPVLVVDPHEFRSSVGLRATMSGMAQQK